MLKKAQKSEAQAKEDLERKLGERDNALNRAEVGAVQVDIRFTQR